jgi:type IV pilus assembly protein PilM
MKHINTKTISVFIEIIGLGQLIRKVKQSLTVIVLPFKGSFSFWKWVTQCAFFQETVTLNIEDDEIRFLITRGKRIKRWGSAPLPPDAVREGLILDPQIVSAAINDLIASGRLKKGQVIVSLSGIKSVQRIVDLPRMPGKLLGGAIIGEAKKAMSISLEKIYLSWHHLIGKKDRLQSYLLLGIPKNIIDAQVQGLRQTGVNPRLMIIKPVALAKMINRTDALVIDIERDSCTIVVITGSVPVIMRSVVMNTGYSPLERAQHVLQEYERTLQFYDASYLDKPLNPETSLFITGGLADNEELHHIITSGARHRVEPLDCQLRYPPDFPLEQFAVNIGLAMKGAPLSGKKSGQSGLSFIPDLDILPDIYRPRGFPVRQVLLVTGVLVGIALIFPLYQMVNGAVVAAGQHQAENTFLNQKIVLRQTQNKEAQQIEVSIASMKLKQQSLLEQLQSFRKLQERSLRTYDCLYISVVSILPDDVRLLSIIEEDGKLNLAGQAPSYETALGYADALRMTDGFSEVRVLSLKRATDAEDVNFSINLKWK